MPLTPVQVQLLTEIQLHGPASYREIRIVLHTLSSRSLKRLLTQLTTGGLLRYTDHAFRMTPAGRQALTPDDDLTPERH